jgi:hypothetical protein
MKYLLLVLLLVGCEDRYRYVCQNPDNFDKAECQKPRCLFTQTCPEYLVAPVLEKQVERNTSNPAEPTTQAPKNQTNR